MPQPEHVPLSNYREYSPQEMIHRAVEFYDELRRRRSVRQYSARPVPREVIEHCLRAAGTAPSGANMQPWSFVVVSDLAVKRRIREGAEEQERALYEHRASQEWLDALAPLGTDASKPFLEQAPYLIVIFAQRHGLAPDGSKVQHYYVTESVGIATGMLLAAVHHAGLVALTYTPSPMRFLSEILERPNNERPFLVLAVGYPAEDTRVPDIRKKPLDEIATFV
jgi:iodotyrosine deiodinase